jgi:hypothetical protein
MPWAFTQSQPLTSADFIKEAERRGFNVKASTLRLLYRHGLLIPFVYLGARQVTPTPTPVEYEPVARGTWLIELRHVRDRGRLCDLAELPFKPWLRFERKKEDPREWWNGLLYSRYQLLVLPELNSVLVKQRYRRSRDGKLLVRLPQPDEYVRQEAARFRRMALILAAIEARYLPKLDAERLYLVNTDEDEWRRYRDSFDPVSVNRWLGYSATQALEDAEHLLFKAHTFDPVGSSWSQLMRRAPRKAWERLKDAALLAIDYRIAAELLLLFYEDLADRGQAEPLPVISFPNWHPLNERLSYRHGTLDRNLMDLGISPHPRVVLVIEGDTEQVHVPLVWKALDYPNAPELMRVLKLGGVNRDLEKVAAVTAAPLVDGEIGGPEGWQLIKPPTRLLIAVDPEGQFETAAKVARTRNKIMREIQDVLRTQGVTNAKPAELDELVQIHTWSASCYEFTHFTDDELSDGIMTVHTTINGWTRQQLLDRIASERRRRKDIKEVWSQWERKPSKVELANALWPILEGKIRRRLTDPEAPTPEIAEIVWLAYVTAQNWRYESFVLSAAPDSGGT